MRINKQKQSVNRLLDLKVKERTKELELNRDELLKRSQERNLIVSKTVTEVTRSIASIKGLCSLALKDNNVLGRGDYIKRIDVTTDDLSSLINVQISAITESLDR